MPGRFTDPSVFPRSPDSHIGSQIRSHNRMIARDLGKFKLLFRNLPIVTSARVHGPGPSSIDDEINPYAIDSSISYEPKLLEVLVPFFRDERGLALRAAHFAQERPEDQVVADG